MLLYLFALEASNTKMLGTGATAAGVQYFPARVPFVLVDGIDDVEQILESREKAWKRKGLLLEDEAVLNAMDQEGTFSRLCCSVRKDGSLGGDVADSSQFRMLRTYVFTLLGKIVDEIASGCVDPNPYTRGSSDNACRFCPYGPVCHPDTVKGRRNYKAVTAQRFWEDVQKEVEKHG
jgi:ATP-dependent helicase/nuclease subunit B